MIKLFDTVFAQPALPTIDPLPADAFSDVGALLSFIIGGLLLIAGAFAVIYIIWSGFQYLTSAGDPERAQRARSGLIYAIIGIIIIALSYAIVNVVSKAVKSGPPSGGGPGGSAPVLEGPAQQRLPGREGPL